MVALGEQLVERLIRLYGAGENVHFGTFLAENRFSTADDESLAELIDTDARLRLERGLGVDMARYFDAAPDLLHKPISLDAAVEFSLRALAGSEAPDSRAADALVAEYPELAPVVRASSLLSGALWSTGRVRAATADDRELPAEYGPAVSPGREGQGLRYELRERLGAGAHGAVYLAVDRLLSDRGRPAWVAIKVLNAGESGSVASDRLSDEAARARRINHPNVVRVLDRGVSADGTEYIVSEYVEGRTLRAWMEARADAVSPRAAAELTVQIALGVQAAHSVGIVHGDLKPDNVLIGQDGVARLTDFGMAVRIDAGTAPAIGSPDPLGVGNLAFVAPEQFRRDEAAVAPPADVYGVGGLLFYLLTGKLPNGPTAEEAEQHLLTDPYHAEAPRPSEFRPGLDSDLEAICRRALSPQIALRYASAEALATDLRAWLRSEPIAWARPSRARRLGLLLRREPLLAPALGLAIGMAATAGGVGVWFTHRAERRLAAERIAAADRLERETREWYTRWEKSLAVSASVFRAGAPGSMNEQWLATLTLLEALAGPVMLEHSQSFETLWNDRIRRVESIIAKASAAGRDADIETTLWRTALALWLLRADRAGDAAAALAPAEASARESLAPGDRLLRTIDLFKAACTIKAGLKRSAEVALTAEEVREVQSATGRFEAALPDLAGDGGQVAVHRLALECLTDAYGPGLLNDPVRRSRLDTELRRARR